MQVNTDSVAILIKQILKSELEQLDFQRQNCQLRMTYQLNCGWKNESTNWKEIK